MRASAFAPKHVKDQLKARFGVDVGDKVSYESERLGGFVSDVSFGEVTQTVEQTSMSMKITHTGTIRSTTILRERNLWTSQNTLCHIKIKLN